MATLRGLVSFTVILFCTDLFCGAEEDFQKPISVPESEHFCTKVMSGRFEHIQLVNIEKLVLFELGNRMLTSQYVPTEPNEDGSEPEFSFRVVTDAYSMSLNDTYEEWFNEAARIPRWFEAHKQEQDGDIRRFYRFIFEADAFFEALARNESGSPRAIVDAVAKSRVIYLAYTDRSLYTWDLKFEAIFTFLDELVEPLSKVAITKDKPELALLYKIENDIATGYVIQKDSQTGNFIIFDFMYDGKPGPKGFWSRAFTSLKDMFRSFKKSKLVKPEDLKLDRKVYYFMEKTDNPHEIRLVHRDHLNGSSADRQLFRDELPNGFQYNGSQYLFDGSLGCVYVIQNFEFNLTQQFESGKVDIRLARVNIPYEQYFKCPDKYKLADDFAQRHRADRCDSAIGEDGAPRQKIDQHMSTGLFWTLFGLCAGFLLMAILFVGLTIFWKKYKTPKIGKKKRPIGPKDLESANKCNKTLTTCGTTDASGTTTTAVSSSADATVQSGTAK